MNRNSIVVPRKTRHVHEEQEFKKIKNEAYIVYIFKETAIDEHALIETLKEKI